MDVSGMQVSCELATGDIIISRYYFIIFASLIGVSLAFMIGLFIVLAKTFYPVRHSLRSIIEKAEKHVEKGL